MSSSEPSAPPPPGTPYSTVPYARPAPGREAVPPAPAVEAGSPAPAASVRLPARQAWIARSLSIGGLALLAFTLVPLLFAALPPRPTAPDWVLQQLRSLLQASPSLLVGALLVSVAQLFDPYNLDLRQRADWLHRVSRWFGLALLLLLPLLPLLGWQELRGQDAQERQGIEELQGHLKALQASRNAPELQAAAAAVPHAEPLPAFTAPEFAATRSRAAEALQGRINRATNTLDETKASRFKALLAQSLRDGLQAVVMALAFLAI
jgi:hypothetical protein